MHTRKHTHTHVHSYTTCTHTHTFRLLAVTNECWKRVLAHSNAQRANDSRRAHIARKLLARMRNKTASLAFQRWALGRAERVSLRCKALKILSWWLRRTRSHTFESWWQYARVQAHQLDGKVVVRLQQYVLVVAYSRWINCLEEAVSLRCMHQRHLHIQLKVIQKIKSKTLKCAVAQWMQHILELRRLIHTCNRAVLIWMHRSTSGALDSWRHRLAHDKQQRLLIAQIVERLCNKWSAIAWRRWVSVLAVKTAARAREGRQNYLKQKITRRLQQRNLAVAFLRWSQLCSDRRRVRWKASYALKRWLNVALTRSFTPWKQTTRQERQKCKVLMEIFIRLWHRLLAQTLLAWLEAVDEQTRRQQQHEARAKSDVLISGLGTALTSLRQSEGARAKLESMVVDLSDELQDCHHELVRALKGGEQVCGLSLHKWRQNCSQTTRLTPRDNPENDLVEALRRHLTVARAGLRSIRCGQVGTARTLSCCKWRPCQLQ